MSSSPSPDAPSQLARFPLEVRDAYQRFRDTGDAAAVHIVVLAALRDFLPKGGKVAADAELTDDRRLIEDLGYDSLAIAEIVFFLEDLFCVTISTRDIQSVRTVGELRAFVTRKLAEKPADA